MCKWSPSSGTVAKILPFTRNDDFSKCGASVVSGSESENWRASSSLITLIVGMGSFRLSSACDDLCRAPACRQCGGSEPHADGVVEGSFRRRGVRGCLHPYPNRQHHLHHR